MTPPAARSVLDFDGFGFAYPDRPRSLCGIDLSVESGEFVLVAGRSGSGKSTLLRAACGLVPHHFGGTAEGFAEISGLDLRDHRAAELAEHCGCVLQDPESQIVMGSVRHEIAFPLENLGRSQAAIDAAVDEVSRSLGIAHLLDRRTAELSGGELQRVALAAALAPRPPLLVLDEPTAQLDPIAAEEFHDAVERVRLEHGTAVLIAEHRLDRVLDRAGRVLALDRGEIVFDGNAEHFLEWAVRDPRGAPLLPPSVSPYPRPARSGGGRAAVAPVAPALAVDGVEFTHRGASHPALRAVDLSLAPGERVALMGSNGSGKSTLLRVARGLIEPSAGRVVASGEVGLLLQNPNDYLIHDRVADEAPEPALRRFELDGFGDRDPRDLSGGERQRLALAIVTQTRPAALLLDEPTRGMDRERRLDLLDQLNAIADAGTAVLLATHDRALAEAFADRVLRIEDGALLDVAARPSVQATQIAEVFA